MAGQVTTDVSGMLSQAIFFAQVSGVATGMPRLKGLPTEVISSSEDWGGWLAEIEAWVASGHQDAPPALRSPEPDLLAAYREWQGTVLEAERESLHSQVGGYHDAGPLPCLHFVPLVEEWSSDIDGPCRILAVSSYDVQHVLTRL